jgi:cytochrome c biogenesis protein CcmG/thiol:disulfide interchange protein DsbE
MNEAGQPNAPVPAAGPERSAASPSRALLALAAAFFLLAAVIVAYSLGQRSTLDGVPRFDPDQPAGRQAAPPFEAPSLRGPERIALDDFRGQIVVINFFASWCGPCELEAADLERAWQANRQRGVTFLGIAIQDTPEQARAFLARHRITYPAVIDARGEIMQAYRVTAIPTTFIVDRAARITGWHAGIFVGDEGVARLQERIDRAREVAR